MSLERFPQLPVSALGRPLYFEEPPEYIHELRERGYEIVLLATLSRSSQEDEQAYLRAKLRGVEEGTIKTDKVLLAALQEAIKLAFRDKQPEETRTKDAIDWLASLDWKPTRHTLKNNTTIQTREATTLELLAPED